MKKGVENYGNVSGSGISIKGGETAIKTFASLMYVRMANKFETSSPEKGYKGLKFPHFGTTRELSTIMFKLYLANSSGYYLFFC